MKWITYHLKEISLAVVLLTAIMSLEFVGTTLNYKLRNYYLSHNTASTTGYIEGIKRISVMKKVSEEFYLIDFQTKTKNESGGLIKEYSERDNNYFNQFTTATPINKTLTIEKLKGKEVEIIYSRTFPSFFRINK
ncbi:hypothetical protein DMA11_00950 [Marinilabiliaceae bacterium JC017]|nr:hypothetical protein DMA11_00950 [Marinilabiliaceae bacterium JC017]